jgi:transketolase
VEPEALEHARQVVARGQAAHAQWQRSFDSWRQANVSGAALFDRLIRRELPAGWAEKLPTWEPDKKGVATRKASGEVLSAIGEVLPELWGGSADLGESNNTTIKGADSFGPEKISTKMWTAHPYGRTLHFGVREHAMGAILNGIVLHGPTRPYGGTFLIFSDYMRPAVRLAALMQAPTIYIWTHDSIGLGEDGPTHQPVEHLAALRAIPGLDVVRPADANETAAAWKALLEKGTRPTGLALTRQGVPVLEGTDAAGVARGGYVLSDTASDVGGGGLPDVLLIATGSEVQFAVAAQQTLAAEGIKARVVSMPCVEWFDAQGQAYYDQILPPSVKARVAVEAGIAMPWHRFVGDHGEVVSLEHFGASADWQTLYREFGFTGEAVADAARRSLERVKRIKH